MNNSSVEKFNAFLNLTLGANHAVRKIGSKVSEYGEKGVKTLIGVGMGMGENIGALNKTSGRYFERNC